MKWNDAKTNPPNHTNEVLVSDRHGSFAVAWYSPNSLHWYASKDMLDAENHDGRCCISIDSNEVRLWAEIEQPNNEAL